MSDYPLAKRPRGFGRCKISSVSKSVRESWPLLELDSPPCTSTCRHVVSIRKIGFTKAISCVVLDGVNFSGFIRLLIRI
jgi:hypothetical protein